MLRPIILMAGFILVAVILIAPSLPTGERRDDGPLTGDSTAPPEPETVDSLFATDDSSVVSQPDRYSARRPRSDYLIDLSAYDSPESRAARAPEY